MQTISELNDVVQELIALCSGVNKDRIILADQGRRPPAGGLYATYKSVPIRAYGHVSRVLKYTDATEAYDEELLGENWQDLEEVMLSSVELMISVNFFNEGADQAALMLQNAGFRSPVSAYLFRKQLAFRYVSPPRNLSTYYQSGIQPRWQTDVFLFVQHEVSSNILRAAGAPLKFIAEE